MDIDKATATQLANIEKRTGKGSREMIVGTGKDDASDALDRRVEFKTVQCAGKST